MSQSNAMPSSPEALERQMTQMAAYPAVMPPPGVTAYVDHGYRNNLPGIVILCILQGILLCCLGCRAYSKLYLVGKVWWDDAALVLGTLGTFLAFGGTICQMTAGSVGYHTWDLSMGAMITPANLVACIVGEWGAAISTIFVKTSLFLTYWLLFGMIRWFRFTLIAIAPLLIAAHLGCNLINLVYYTPPPGRSMIGQMIYQFFNPKIADAANWGSLVSVLTDFVLVILPMPAVLHMRLPWRRKLGVILVLSAGLLTCAAAIGELYWRWCTGDVNVDMFRKSYSINCLSMVEYIVANCCACAPAVAQVLSYTRVLAPLGDCIGLNTSTTGSYSSGSFSSTVSDETSKRGKVWFRSGSASDEMPMKLQATVTTTIVRTTGEPGEDGQMPGYEDADPLRVPRLFEGNAGIDVCRGVTTYISAPPRRRRRG